MKQCETELLSQTIYTKYVSIHYCGQYIFSAVFIYVTVVRFEVFTAVTMKNGVFWVVTPCGSCKNPEDTILYVTVVF
jgi:hypothetical protein